MVKVEIFDCLVTDCEHREFCQSQDIPFEYCVLFMDMLYDRESELQVTCLHCGEWFKHPRRNQQYCSVSCRKKARKLRENITRLGRHGY